MLCDQKEKIYCNSERIFLHCFIFLSGCIIIILYLKQARDIPIEALYFKVPLLLHVIRYINDT